MLPVPRRHCHCPHPLRPFASAMMTTRAQDRDNCCRPPIPDALVLADPSFCDDCVVQCNCNNFNRDRLFSNNKKTLRSRDLYCTGTFDAMCFDHKIFGTREACPVKNGSSSPSTLRLSFTPGKKKMLPSKARQERRTSLNNTQAPPVETVLASTTSPAPASLPALMIDYLRKCPQNTTFATYSAIQVNHERQLHK